MPFSITKERMSMYARFVEDTLKKKENLIEEKKI